MSSCTRINPESARHDEDFDFGFSFECCFEAGSSLADDVRVPVRLNECDTKPLLNVLVHGLQIRSSGVAEFNRTRSSNWDGRRVVVEQAVAGGAPVLDGRVL
jgi:hypothetical protein